MYLACSRHIISSSCLAGSIQTDWNSGACITCSSGTSAFTCSSVAYICRCIASYTTAKTWPISTCKPGSTNNCENKNVLIWCFFYLGFVKLVCLLYQLLKCFTFTSIRSKITKLFTVAIRWTTVAWRKTSPYATRFRIINTIIMYIGTVLASWTTPINTSWNRMMSMMIKRFDTIDQ